ncbi:MAG: hypothetical protein ACREC1_05405 [Methylovirgula sp.]
MRPELTPRKQVLIRPANIAALFSEGMEPEPRKAAVPWPKALRQCLQKLVQRVSSAATGSKRA